MLSDGQIAKIAHSGNYPISEYVSVDRLTYFARSIESECSAAVPVKNMVELINSQEREIENMRHDIDRYVAICSEQATEIEKLRLERDNYKTMSEAALSVSGRIKNEASKLGRWAHDERDELDYIFELAESVESLRAQLAEAKAIQSTLIQALREAEHWLEGWASATFELGVIRAALSAAKAVDADHFRGATK